MGLFKEEMHFLEGLARRQVRIWLDSCDAGIHAKDIDLNAMRETIRSLLTLPGSKVIWRSDKPATQRTYRLVVMIERTEGTHSGAPLYSAMVYYVNYYRRKSQQFSRVDEFFTIKCEPTVVDENGKAAF